MASPSSSGVSSILASAREALQRIDDVIDAQRAYENEVVELYEIVQRARQRACAKSYPLVRTGPGSYRTPVRNGKRGTASNLQIAATSGAPAKIKTRSGEYDAQKCYERALAFTRVDTESDAFKNVVYAAFKAWLCEEVSERSLSEWENIRGSISRAVEDAAPLETGFLSRLLLGGRAREKASNACDALRKLDVEHIARNMDYWPEYSANHMDTRDEVYASFLSGGENREGILRCLERLVGNIEAPVADSRPFTSEEARAALDQLQKFAEISSLITAARKTVEQAISDAIDSLRERYVQTRLAEIPIDELGKAKTGAQIKKLQAAGVDTLCDLYTRMCSPEQGDFPGVGPKTLFAVKAFLEPLISGLKDDWHPVLDSNYSTKETSLLVRALQARFDLEKLQTEAEQALSKMGALDTEDEDNLRFVTDQIDWLLADDTRIKAAAAAMNAAQQMLESKEGKQLLSLSRGAKLKKLTTNLVAEEKAWKALEAHPARFRKAIEKFAPGATEPTEKQKSAKPPRGVKPTSAAGAPVETSRTRAESKKLSGETPSAKQGGTYSLGLSSENVSDTLAEGKSLAMFYPPIEYLDSDSELTKPIVNDHGPRAQGTHFSCAVPDGWTESGKPGSRPFILVPSKLSAEDQELKTAVLYCDCGLDEEDSSLLKMCGTPAFMWARNYINIGMMPQRYIEMHEVAGRNCRCTVEQVRTNDSCYEFYVVPNSLTSIDFLRICFYEPGGVTYEEALTFANNLARTIEVREPAVAGILERFDERFLEKDSLEDAENEVAFPVFSSLHDMNQSIFEAGENFCTGTQPNATEDEIAAAGVCGITQYLDVCVPYAERIVHLTEQWLGCHTASASDIESAKQVLQALKENLALRTDMFKISLPKRELARLAKPTLMQKALVRKIEVLLATLEEDPDGRPEKEGLAT